MRPYCRMMCPPSTRGGNFQFISALSRPSIGLHHNRKVWDGGYYIVLFKGESHQSNNPTYQITQYQHEAHPVYINSSLKAQHVGLISLLYMNLYSFSLPILGRRKTKYRICCQICTSCLSLHHNLLLCVDLPYALFPKNSMTAYNTNTQF